MDEIDAALDFRNVSIVANYIAERTKNAQFVIISLRNNMFELADRLVGIYKTSHCTKSIAINPNMIATLTATPTHTSAASSKRSSAPNISARQDNTNSTAPNTPITEPSKSNIEQNTAEPTTSDIPA
jgi:structural maintenance of chromosome 4